jgi:hypothetical protein
MKSAGCLCQKHTTQLLRRSGPLAWRFRKNGPLRKSTAGGCIKMSLLTYSELGVITIVTVAWILVEGM